MKSIRTAAIAIALILPLASCANYNAYQNAKQAESEKNWDRAVAEYSQALEIDPRNTRFKMALQRAKLAASRSHFEKGKSLRAAADSAAQDEQIRLIQLSATEFELAVKLDPTNQYAAVELDKSVRILNEAAREAGPRTMEEMKKRAAERVTKAQPPQLNPASAEPISLSFPRETPVKDIYRALGNAFGINVLFDQAVKDDRISIELRDVTAQQALERVMQAGNHFYKVLDEKTIIVIPDNPQSRRDYEDLVIQTFYLSNGDAEQVSNVLRTMLEARQVFPLKQLNAITIRDTADKVRIAAKIIEANDKAKSEVVVTVELVQLDLNKVRDIGLSISGSSGAPITPFTTDAEGKRVPFGGGTLDEIGRVIGSADAIRNNLSFTIPTASYSLLKTLGNSELLANPELRISEGEKATLHIGQRIPVPVSTFTSVSTGGNSGTYAPVTSFQYQDVGIKVSMEPRVHHNREVTLKLTVEVSNQGDPVQVEGQPPQPTFVTRTIESTIRLRDGETNFLAGLIQETSVRSESKTPFLGEIPFIGRLFTRTSDTTRRNDLVMTMTPHIIRIPDIDEDDLAPMWVGTQNNITFRGVSPRIESQNNGDPFAPPFRVTGERIRGNDGTAPEVNTAAPAPTDRQGNPAAIVPGGGGPGDPFRQPTPPAQPPQQPQNPPVMLGTPAPESASIDSGGNRSAVLTASATSTKDGMLRFAPRISPQPVTLSVKPGEQKMWNVVGMDLDGLTTPQLVFRFDSRAFEVMEAMIGPAMVVNPAQPPIVTISRESGTVKITSSNGKPLSFRSGGEVVAFRVQGSTLGDSSLIVESAQLSDASGAAVAAVVSGGTARVE